MIFLYCVLFYIIYSYFHDYIIDPAIQYYFNIKGCKFCKITFQYRRWKDSGHLDAYPLSTYHELAHSKLSEPHEMTVLVSDLGSDQPNEICVAPVDLKGNWITNTFDKNNMVEVIHIPLAQVSNRRDIPSVSFWQYLYNGQKITLT